MHSFWCQGGELGGSISSIISTPTAAAAVTWLSYQEQVQLLTHQYRFFSHTPQHRVLSAVASPFFPRLPHCCPNAHNDALQACLVGARQFNSFGSHGATEHVQLIHFPTIEACCTYLKESAGVDLLTAVK